MPLQGKQKWHWSTFSEQRTVTNSAAERSRLLTGTSTSLSKGVKPEGEDNRSNGDVAADKFLSVLPCVKSAQEL